MRVSNLREEWEHHPHSCQQRVAKFESAALILRRSSREGV